MAETVTIIDHLEQAVGKKNFGKLVTDTLAAAGLRSDAALDGKADLVLTRIKASVPDAHWLAVGEKASVEVEHRYVTGGRWTTKISVHFDRPRLLVAECHTRGVEGDYDHSAWANVKTYPNAAKAEAAWTKLLAKYKLGAPPPPKAKPAVVPATADERALKAQLWANPDDRAALQVLADAWAERNDPRGEYIQLCLLAEPTDAQRARKAALEKSSGKLVGPAREHITRWEFGANGLVDVADTDAERLVAGFDEIAALNPRLTLTISTQKLGAVKALAARSLAPFHFLVFPTKLSDKKLELLAPALAAVRNLSFMCRGASADYFGPAGLRALGDAATELEYIELDYYSAGDLAPFSEYIDVLVTHPGFRNLRVVTTNGTEAEAKPLKKLPKLVQAVRIEYQTDIRPANAAHLAELKAGRALKR